MKVVDIVSKVLLLCSVLIFFWATLDRYLRQILLRRRMRNEDFAWYQLNNHIDTMRALLGPAYSMESYTKADGSHEIHLECRKCRRKNRLVKGFRNAACSNCHTSFVTPADETTPFAATQKQNESRPN